MIEYIEVRSGTTRELIGIIDTAQSIIWRNVYYGVGEFEIYTAATDKALNLLKSGNIVTRPNDINCGIISSLEITNSRQSGKMITAKGYFAKIILNRRIIYKFVSTYSVTAQVLRGNVATACWNLINANCGTAAPTNRQFSKFGRGAINYLPAVILDGDGNAAEKQVTYSNLLEYTDKLLQEYKYGAYIWLDTLTKEYLYVMYSGADRTRGNTEGNKPLVFSRDYDNLAESEYTYTADNFKTTAIIGGEGEGLSRFVSRKGDNLKGYDRREMFVDLSSITKTVKNEDDTETTYTDSQYSQLLIQGSNKEFETHKREESFLGTLDLTYSKEKYVTDYNCGDLITIEDKEINKTANVRILEVTEAQENGAYNIDIKYSADEE